MSKAVDARVQCKRWALFCVGAVVFACMPKSEPSVPAVTPASTLALNALAGAAPAKFALVYAGPKGPATGDPAIQLVFSHPLRALGPDTPVPSGLQVSPATLGHWEWVGVHGLTFVPEAGRLRRATDYHVEVPAEISSVAGETLGEVVEFDFATPTTYVESSSPGRWNSDSKPSTPIVLTFSEPVEASKIAPYVFATVEGEAQELIVEPGKAPHLLVVRSKNGWPLASSIDYGVRAGFPSNEGAVPARKGFGASFKTYGPLTATVHCERDELRHCRPEGGLTLLLSNPVSAKKLSRVIRARGAKLRVDRDWSKGSKTRHISLGTRLKPRQRFSVLVGPIVDIYGQSLSFIRDRQVVVADYRPDVQIGFEGDSLPLKESRIAVVSTNASYELVTAALTPEQLATLNATSTRKRFQALKALQVSKYKVVPVGKVNKKHRHILALDSVTQRGPFAVGVRYTVGGQTRRSVRWGQRTDLAVSVKAGRKRSYAWVTDLRSGAPLAGARLRVLGAQQTALSDGDGLASLPSGSFLSAAKDPVRPNWLEVKHGDQVAYRPSDGAMDSWRIPVTTDFYGDPEDIAFLFPERDIFRPGEKAWVKAYLRRPGRVGNELVVGEALSVSLVSPDDELVRSHKVTTNSYGAASAQLKIPASGRLGYWNVQLRRGEEVLASSSIQVAEFRRSEFSVEARAMQKEVVIGAPTDWSVKGSYFYGGVMKDAKVETALRRTRTPFTPPGLDGYRVGDDAYQLHEQYQHYSPFLSSKRSELDSLGEYHERSKIELPHQVGPERVHLEATVTDLSAQTASAQASVLVHPAAYYVALKRAESHLVDVQTTLTPLVRTVTPGGRKVTGKSVSLFLYRLRWAQVKRASGGISSQTVTRLVKELVSSCSLKTSNLDQGCGLLVKEAGEHILRAVSIDAQGRKALSSTKFYAVGDSSVASFRDDDARRTVELSPDRETYSPGQTARILIKSPFLTARAWVTVEKNGVLSQKMIRVKGSTPTVELRIDETMRPNAYVGVHLIEDRAVLGKRAHAMGDSYRIGYTELRIDPEQRRLKVSARATKSEYRPGQTVELELGVKDTSGQGRAAEVTVFVVDEGVLTLSGYQLPDPLAVFTRPQPLRVETTESRETLARIFGLEPNKNENKGHPGGGGGEERAVMLTTAYFNPAIETNSAGQARVTFKLPDNLGRFRIMALAVTEDDRYGKGQGGFAVNRPLMVRPALPRFLRAGDEVQLSAVVSSLGNPSEKVQVSVRAEGLSLLDTKPKLVELEQNSSAFVSFGAKALRSGPSKIRFSVAGAKERDSVSLKRRVDSPAQVEAVALYGTTQSAEAHQLGALSDVRRDLGGLDVTLSSSALVGLKGGFEQLWDYPYQCSEQLSSRLMPLLVLKDFAKLYGIAVPEDTDQRVGRDLRQLIRRQRGDGGFGMWPESQRSSPYVSAYALWVLHEAQQRGASVPKQLFQRGARFLQDLAAARDESALPNAVFASFALAKIGKGDKNTINALYEHVESLPVESQMVLLWTAALLELSEVTVPLIERAESAITLRGNDAEITQPRVLGNGLIMSSDIRRHAVTLNALLAAKPSHSLAAPLVRSLLTAREGGRWQNTQESAFALLSLDSYRKAQERVEPEFQALLFLDKELLAEEQFSGRSVLAKELSVPMRRLAGGGDLVFQRVGQGRLFFEARLKYARTQLPKQALERGFLVQKTMTPLGADWRSPSLATSDRSSVAHGGMVLVELMVLAPTARRFVVIDDPLPAGLEAIDMSLSNAQGSLRSLLRPSAEERPWHRSEFRDDRVLYFVDDMPAGVYKYGYLARATTRGTFVTPPTRAMEMYQEEVYGRTGARSFQVQ